jgi:hypothetical protein
MFIVAYLVEKILRLLLKVHYHVHNGPTLYHNVSQLNPIHVLTSALSDSFYAWVSLPF